MPRPKKNQGQYGLPTGEIDVAQALECLLTGQEASRLLDMLPAELSRYKNSGVFTTGNGKYKLATCVAEYIRFLKARTKKGGDQKLQELEQRKLEAQIESAELRNLDKCRQLKLEAIEETKAELTAEVIALKTAVKARPDMAQAFGILIDDILAKLTTIDGSTVKASVESGVGSEETD